MEQGTAVTTRSSIRLQMNGLRKQEHLFTSIDRSHRLRTASHVTVLRRSAQAITTGHGCSWRGNYWATKTKRRRAGWLKLDRWQRLRQRPYFVFRSPLRSAQPAHPRGACLCLRTATVRASGRVGVGAQREHCNRMQHVPARTNRLTAAPCGFCNTANARLQLHWIGYGRLWVMRGAKVSPDLAT